MKNLMKYEFRKTWATKLILLGITAAAQAAFLAGLYLEKDNLLGFSVFVLTMLAIGGMMLIGLGSVLTLHRDINTKQSYMLFMTPNSCYKILGAKVLENGLSILLGGAFYFALGVLDITLLFSKEGNIHELWQLITEMIHSINKEIPLNTTGLACLFFGLLTSWFATVTMAFLADVVSSALLNGKKYNGVLSVALFLVLSLLLGWVQQSLVSIQEPNRYFLISGGIALAYSVLMYAGASEIMERKLSV